ncbi:glycosyltransferase family 4 protein [Geobacter sp. SVR]|uniref:glycosyltransferase family 4 protein n=1 Tax=Geobacter sp. SVR TaxID=2495594 RepID=UPI00143EF9B9|nr:glycosyltransferase family 4 protein [Geobacter sp. SVR]BCS51984.1 glycosyl transferase [Geobacter sp. SVR]GCF87201.1 glycosyl transferase family 1 [Geobacter sp. SVR]
MKILFVTPRFPYPPHRGDTSVPYHRMRLLSQRHEITLLSFYENEDELSDIDGLRSLCRRIETVRLPKWRSYSNMVLMGLLSRMPLQVLYYLSGKFRTRLNELLKDEAFDVIHVFMLRIAPYFFDIPGPKVIDLIDSMQLNFQRRVQLARLPKRLLLQEELRRVSSYERNIGQHFDQLVVVSQKDGAHIPSGRVNVIPLGVDTDIFSPEKDVPQCPVIIFSGNMFYSPNIQAVTWFVESCFPRIQRVLPTVSLLIVGNKPPKTILDLGQKAGITVTGFVASMPDALQRSSVSVTPMRSGSGMQFKILEAMACGLPVVTTTLGLGDIKARPGEEIFVKDSPEEFADAVILLLSTPELVQKIGEKARRFVVQNHSWESAAASVERVYEDVLENKRGRSFETVPRAASPLLIPRVIK